MAFYYLDTNGTTPGFGTLNALITTGSLVPNCTLSSTGTTTPAGVSFSVANAHSLSFGSSGGTAAPGTMTINSGNFAAFNQLWYQNVTGNQTITNGVGTGYIQFVGTTPYCDVSATGRLDVNCFIQGTVNWEKRGSSIMRLLKANTFSGGMTIAAGTVEIANASALGTGTVTMTGGKLSSSSGTGYALANALTLNGTMTLGDTTNNGYMEFNGALTLTGNTTLTASNNVIFNGAGTSAAAYNLSVTQLTEAMYFRGGAGAFAGGTATFSGAVFLANFNSGTPNQIAGFSTLTFNSDLQILGNTAHTFANAIGGTGTVYVRNTSASGITFNGSMASYTGSLRAYADSVEGANPVQKLTLTRADQFGFGSFWFQNGGGLTTLSQTLTYTGSANVSADTYLSHYAVSASPTAVFQHYGTGGATVTFSNASKWFSNDNTVDFALKYDVGPSAGLLTVAVPYKEFFTGKFSFEKLGVGPMTLSGDNQISKTFTVSAGTLNANSATAMGQSSTTAAISVTSDATLSLGAAATYTLRTLTVAGNGSASAPNNGALVIANTGTSAFGGITLGSTTYIRATNDGLLDASFTPGGYSLILGAAAGVTFTPFANIAKVFSGTGSVTYGSHSGDTGTVFADVQHTYTGNTTLAFGTTRVSTADVPGTRGPLGAKLLTAANTLLMTGGVLQYGNGNSRDYSGRFSTAGSQQWKIDVNGDNTITYATALSGASSLLLRDTFGGGSLTLSSAASTFSGGVTLTEGTLYAGAAQNGVSGPLGITGTITFSPAGTGVLAYTAASATFDYSSRFATTNGQTRRIDVNGESVTFSTVIGGTNAFALVGLAGTLTLAAANTYTQGTALSSGILKCSNVQSLGTGASAGLAQANGTTLHVATADGKMTITGAHTNTGTGSRTIRIGAA